MKLCVAFPLALLTGIITFAPMIQGAEKVPKEMKPKLIREGKVLIDEKFGAAELDKKWIIPAGEFAGTARMEEGHVVIESGTGRQGAIWQRFEPGVADASMQALLMPKSCIWVGMRFMSAKDDSARQWKIATIIYASGLVRVVTPTPDGKQLQVLKSAKTGVKPGEWWRVSVENRGDRFFVRVNGEDMMEVKDKLAEGEKAGFMINLYGGNALADEIKVMAAGK